MQRYAKVKVFLVFWFYFEPMERYFLVPNRRRVTNRTREHFFTFWFRVRSLITIHDAAANISPSNVFRGFNSFAYATVIPLATCGLLVSCILKHLDNFIKCFCSAFSMLCVALIDSAMKNEAVPMHMLLAIVLTGIALEQYNSS